MLWAPGTGVAAVCHCITADVVSMVRATGSSSWFELPEESSWFELPEESSWFELPEGKFMV